MLRNLKIFLEYPINDRTRRVFLSTLLFIIIGSSFVGGCYFLIYFKMIPENKLWLLINPSLSKNEDLNWIYGVWSGILTIHGTIAALSIAFMGQFGSYASETAPSDFSQTCRRLVLRQYSFYEISVKGICGLFIGMYFYIIGSGVLFYSVSMLLSLYYILLYMVVFGRLYLLTEQKEIINKLLFNYMNNLSLSIYAEQSRQDKYIESFKQAISSLGRIRYGSPDYFSRSKFTSIDTPVNEDKLIVGHNNEKLQELNEYVEKKFPNENFVIHFDLQRMYDNPTGKFAYILHDESCVDDNIAAAKLIAADCFFYKKYDEKYDDELKRFTELENAIMQCVCKALVKNDDELIAFCHSAISIVYNNIKKYEFIDRLTYKISQGLGENIRPKTLSSLFIKVYYVISAVNNDDSALFLYDMYHSAFTLYKRSEFREFVYENSDFLKDQVKFSSAHLIKRSYANICVLLLSNFYYDELESVSKVIDEVEFLLENEPEERTQELSYLVGAMKTVVTYASMRLSHLLITKNNDDIEVQKLLNILKKWINPKIINEVYYNKETYFYLFDNRLFFESLSAESEIIEAKGVYVSTLETYKLLAINIMFANYSNSNSLLSLRYVRNLRELTDDASISIHDIETLINNFQNEFFVKLYGLISETHTCDKDIISKNKGFIQELNELKQVRKNSIKLIIHESPLDPTLVGKYQSNFVKHVIKKIGTYINFAADSECYKNVNISKSYLVNKVELIPSIDTTYIQHSNNYAEKFVEYIMTFIVQKFIKDIDVCSEIEDSKILPSDGVITINSCGDFPNCYRFYKGYRMLNNNKQHPFTNDGFYYVYVNDFLDIKRIEPKDISINFRELTDDESRNDVLMDDYEKIIAEITVSIYVRDAGKRKVYFLPKEKCHASA